MANTTLSWVCPLTCVPSLSYIYAYLQHSFIKWTNQDHIPLDDEQFSEDDCWVLINPSTFAMSWVITNQLSPITAMFVLLFSWVCLLLLYFIIFLHYTKLRLRGGVEMIVIFTCGYLTLWLSTLIIVLLGYGLIANLINISFYYSRGLRPT
jgi:hypothetical protein